MPPISELCTSCEKTLILITLGKWPEEERYIGPRAHLPPSKTHLSPRVKLLLRPTQPTLAPLTKELRTRPSGVVFMIYAKAGRFFLLYKREKLRFWKSK